MNYACAAAVGAISGLRSMTGPAIITVAARSNRLGVERTPLSWLGSPKASTIATVLAGGEMIADKFPFIPDRIKPGPLAGRAIAGALCGYAVFSSRGKRDALIGALVGGSAALAASWAGYQYRRRTPLPAIAAGVIEDAVAATAGALVIRNLCA